MVQCLKFFTSIGQCLMKKLLLDPYNFDSYSTFHWIKKICSYVDSFSENVVNVAKQLMGSEQLEVGKKLSVQDLNILDLDLYKVNILFPKFENFETKVLPTWIKTNLIKEN